ncbi:MAG: CapA family protein, partial [Gaiellales bacterium]
MDEWEAYERRRSDRERMRDARRRARMRRRRLTAAAFVVAAIGLAGYLAAGRLAGGRPHRLATAPPTSGAAQHSPATSDPASTADAQPKPTGRLTLVAVGDTMLGSTPTLPPDPAGYLAGVRPQFRADVVFGNLEGTLTDRTDGKCGGAPSANCFAFRAPPSYARYLRRAGFTVLSNANNHSFDYWQPGQQDTVNALHRA